MGNYAGIDCADLQKNILRIVSRLKRCYCISGGDIMANEENKVLLQGLQKGALELK